MNSLIIFIVAKEDYDRYQLKYLLETLSENVIKIVIVDTHKAKVFGKCLQILQCKDYIDLAKPVIVASYTQLFEWDANAFLYSLANPAVHGGILTFKNVHPRYSYIDVDEDGWIVNVAVKKPISTTAAAGIYYWKRGFDLIKYSAVVVAKNDDSSNKNGIILAFQEGIKGGMQVKPFSCRRVWELSTPRDLDFFHMSCK